jgi:hypothetical protein
MVHNWRAPATAPSCRSHEQRIPAASYPSFVKLASIRIWLRANESTPQKNISSQMGSRPFKDYLSNRGIVAIGLTVDARAMGQLIDDDRNNGALLISKVRRPEEAGNHNPGVGGSSPSLATKTADDRSTPIRLAKHLRILTSSSAAWRLSIRRHRVRPTR